ncbi:hypothetical protein L7F22_051901 [Adiantum nelumboides]|nr:hypothetical protein [Adiantum nelumboides]
MAAASSSCFYASLVELPFKRHTPSPWSSSRTLTVKEFKQSRKPILGCVCSSIVGDLVSSLPLEEIQRILQDDNTVSSTIRSGIATIAELPEEQRWQTLGGTAVGWVYLTARPNVLWGAVDAFVLAPLQFVADKLLGRRGYKRTDFLVEQRVGEGSFGTVFAGALVPRNVEWEEELGRRSRRIEELQNSKSFQKVILKKVGVCISISDM